MKKSFLLIVTLLLYDSCIDKFELSAPNTNLQLVVDGFISDAPGPYTVKLSRSRKLVDFTPFSTVSAQAVTIIDNLGNAEILKEIDAGIYQTNATGIRGVIGREYFVRIETRDGKTYESIPEKIKPAGQIDSIYYNFEQYNPESGPTQYRFRVFMDARGEAENENLFLWKLIGTYKVITSPKLHFIRDGELIIPDPRPCSGYIWNRKTLTLDNVKPCECCECWASLVPTSPRVSNQEIVVNGNFKKIDVGIIPVEFWPFWDKTMVNVEQISISKKAFDYWKTIQDQKAGATGLFQPAIGKATSNIFLKNGNEEVQGLFYAGAISKKILFLTAKELPLGPGIIPPPPGLGPGLPLKPGDPPPNTFIIRESCIFAFAHSTTQKPIDWN